MNLIVLHKVFSIRVSLRFLIVQFVIIVCFVFSVMAQCFGSHTHSLLLDGRVWHGSFQDFMFACVKHVSVFRLEVRVKLKLGRRRIDTQMPSTPPELQSRKALFREVVWLLSDACPL